MRDIWVFVVGGGPKKGGPNEERHPYLGSEPLSGEDEGIFGLSHFSCGQKSARVIFWCLLWSQSGHGAVMSRLRTQQTKAIGIYATFVFLDSQKCDFVMATILIRHTCM